MQSASIRSGRLFPFGCSFLQMPAALVSQLSALSAQLRESASSLMSPSSPLSLPVQGPGTSLRAISQGSPHFIPISQETGPFVS